MLMYFVAGWKHSLNHQHSSLIWVYPASFPNFELMFSRFLDRKFSVLKPIHIYTLMFFILGGGGRLTFSASWPFTFKLKKLSFNNRSSQPWPWSLISYLWHGNKLCMLLGTYRVARHRATAPTSRTSAPSRAASGAKGRQNAVGHFVGFHRHVDAVQRLRCHKRLLFELHWRPALRFWSVRIAWRPQD